jgi:hypothetical protein
MSEFCSRVRNREENDTIPAMDHGREAAVAEPYPHPAKKISRLEISN